MVRIIFDFLVLCFLDQGKDGLGQACRYLANHKLCYNVFCLVASALSEGRITGGIAAAEKFLQGELDHANTTSTETGWDVWSARGVQPCLKKARRLHERLLQLRIGSAERESFIKCTNLNLSLRYYHKAPIATSCTDDGSDGGAAALPAESMCELQALLSSPVPPSVNPISPGLHSGSWGGSGSGSGEVHCPIPPTESRRSQRRTKRTRNWSSISGNGTGTGARKGRYFRTILGSEFDQQNKATIKMNKQVEQLGGALKK